MVYKIRDKLNEFAQNKDKRVWIIVAVGILGILLVFASEFTGTAEKSAVEESQNDYTAYKDELEEELTDLISSINGAGECKVMVTLESTSESVYAKNSESKSDDSSSSYNDDYVIYDGENGEAPVLIEEYYPKIQGVAVVCTGGDNAAVKENIITNVSSLFNISTNRISVSKISD